MIVLPGDRHYWWAPRDDACFLCHDPVYVFSNSVGVMWAGTTEILLHPGCAAYLGTHLIADSREAQLASGEQPWARRAARALRGALGVQEHT